MNLYIHGTGILSASGNNTEENFLREQPSYNADKLLCKEPDYTSYIPPMQLRRMSKAVRMGIGASKICLQNTGLDKADAISVGTAYGCLHDTEAFLSKVIDQDEQMLTPTAFIQSTHNTVAGQIALVSGCYGHNLTFVHRGHSFEHAMINAQIYLASHRDHNMLVGGIEELTETSLGVLKQAKVYRREPSTAESILNNQSQGSIGGEGAAFFTVSEKASEGTTIVVKDIATFATRDVDNALKNVGNFLDRQPLKTEDIDMLMLGVNGDMRSDEFYSHLRKSFASVSQAAFKHICGEYPVASSFGLGVICNAIKNGVPSHIVLNHAPKQLKRIVLINNYVHHFSCWHIEVS